MQINVERNPTVWTMKISRYGEAEGGELSSWRLMKAFSATESKTKILSFADGKSEKIETTGKSERKWECLFF